MGLAYVVPSLLVVVNYLVIWNHVKRSSSYLRQQGYVHKFCVSVFSEYQIIGLLVLISSIMINMAFYFISVLQTKFDFRIEKWRWLGPFCPSFYVMKYVQRQYRFFFYSSYEEHRIGLFLWWSTYSNSRWIFLFMPSKVSNIAKLMWIT